MKEKRHQYQIKGTERDVMRLCRENKRACDSNTELCIAFWDMKQDEINERTGKALGFEGAIRKYPPESLTKYRRNLIFDVLIFPSKDSREHSLKMEAQNHRPQYQHTQENEWESVMKRSNNLA